ncbi:hypothetical protein SNOG_15851 [Parastagonospora nodorum SN15]|uniref:Uncharacterized protein n=1 Tax=Phaeosphaeria nodorum (strain SN15 / ATCC MYA-4574 / FGSC 10173) TaxID=321614 RepID=Q0TX30_PHANO|nr:hypothetical protein SNOG_15851 [Parastagonospora nodorum SN15]EAT76689.1 hypothetical protein SNOG_15851 [Parastagonospora nodorum SN15]
MNTSGRCCETAFVSYGTKSEVHNAPPYACSPTEKPKRQRSKSKYQR